MSRLVTTLIASVLIAAPIAATAGFNVPGLPGKSANADAGADLPGAQDKLVRQYVEANKTIMLGNAHLADALGLKDEAAALRASGDSLGDGATKGNLADADKATSDTSRKLTEKLGDKNLVLDADAKKKYTAGLVTMAGGLVKYVGMKESFQSFSSSLKSASPMMVPKLQSGAYIVSSLPTNAKNLSAALKSATEFAKSHDIKVPSEATSALNSAF